MLVISLSASHNDELVIGGGLGVGLMSEFVHVVVNNLTQINKGTLVKLKSSGGCHLQSGGVHNTQVSNVELSILRDDHELRLPEFFVVSNDIVIAVAFSDLELGLISAKLNFEVSEFIGVDRRKAEHQLIFLFVVGGKGESAAGHVESDLELLGVPVPRLDVADVHHIEVGLGGVFRNFEDFGQFLFVYVLVLGVTKLATGAALREPDLVSVKERHAAVPAGGLGVRLLDELLNLLRVLGKGHGEVVAEHEQFVARLVSRIEMLLDLVHYAVLAEGANELVGGCRKLSLEEGKPKDACLLRLKSFADRLSLILVDHVFEVDLVKIVGPGVQHLEALILHVLLSVSVNIGLNEVIVRLERDHWVFEIILFNSSSGILQKLRNGLDAGLRLQVLRLDQLIEVLF